MKISCLIVLCAVFTGCSSVSRTNANSTTTAAAPTNAESTQYHAHIITEYSDGATKFLDMSTNEDAENP
jgi:uncharacterized protein YceK